MRKGEGEGIGHSKKVSTGMRKGGGRRVKVRLSAERCTVARPEGDRRLERGCDGNVGVVAGAKKGGPTGIAKNEESENTNPIRQCSLVVDYLQIESRTRAIVPCFGYSKALI